MVWFRGDGSAGFGSANELPVSHFGVTSIDIGDIDGDGDLDVMSANGGWLIRDISPRVGFAWYRNTDGNGSFEVGQSDTAQGTGPSNLTDIDSDGDLDAILGLGVLENTDGTGQFTYSTGAFSGPIHSVVTGDLNGDGNEETVINNKRFTFSRLDLQQAPITGGVILNDLVLHDLDNDEDLDLVVAGFVGFGVEGVGWLENTDAFTMLTEVNEVSNAKTTSIAVGDIDGDGDADIVAAAFDDGEIRWYESDLLDVTERLEGDANEDGEVNFTDFLLLASNFGRADDVVWGDGDFDQNGEVNFSDFLVLAANFGRTRALSKV